MSKIFGYVIGIMVASLFFIFLTNCFNIFPLMGGQQSLELRIHDLVNQEREKNGRAPLDFDPALAEIARKHSEDMARNHYFAHGYPNGRAEEAGYSCENQRYKTGIAENILQNNMGIFDMVYLNSFDILSTSTVKGWMESYGHKQNILGPYYREGIGVAISNNRVFITQDFC